MKINDCFALNRSINQSINISLSIFIYLYISYSAIFPLVVCTFSFTLFENEYCNFRDLFPSTVYHLNSYLHPITRSNWIFRNDIFSILPGQNGEKQTARKEELVFFLIQCEGVEGFTCICIMNRYGLSEMLERIYCPII